MSEKRRSRRLGRTKRKKAFLAVLALSVSMIAAGAVVSAKSMTQTTQKLETGVVEIELESQTEQFAGVLPAQRVFFAPAIICKGYDCYVRAKFEFSDYKDYFGIFRDTGNWVYCKKDGFWYSKQILTTGKKVNVFDGFKVSADLPKEAEGKQVFISVKAEAVQSANFSPDFESEDPWNSVETQVLSKDRIYTVDSGGIRTTGLSVVYEGDADRLVAAPDDFFSNLPTMMPGDRFEQSISLSNRYDQPSEIFFYSLCEDENDLIDKIRLTITSSITGKVYEGGLRSAVVEGDRKAVSLGSIPANAKGTVTFTVEVPKELDNTYVLGKSQVKWVFTTEKRIPKAAEKQKGSPIATGDTNETGFFLMVFGSALLLLSVLIRRKQRISAEGSKI